MSCHRTYSLQRGPDGYAVKVTGRPLDAAAARPCPAAPPQPAPTAPVVNQPRIQIGPLDC